MPLPNRVTPFSTLIATEHRGTLMGNRGRLHDASREVVRNHVGIRWISCRLDFKGRRRQVWAPGRYSELFFLDEATALAAGHRPCAECRRSDVAVLREALALDTGTSLVELDRQLHTDRVACGSQGGTSQRVHGAAVRDLPPGAMVESGGAAWLVTSRGLRAWSPAGYGPVVPTGTGQVAVLTPPLLISAIRGGYPVPLPDGLPAG